MTLFSHTAFPKLENPFKKIIKLYNLQVEKAEQVLPVTGMSSTKAKTWGTALLHHRPGEHSYTWPNKNHHMTKL